MSQQKEVKQIQTKSELAYSFLRKAIIKMDLKPGEKITIGEIARMLSISDIPVREALNKLASEGLVENEPHVGFKVSTISNKQTAERLAIKAELEAMAIRLLTPNISDKQIKKQEKLLVKMKKKQAEQDYLAYFDLIRSYSLELYKSCHNDTLYDLLVTLFSSTETIATIYSLIPGCCDKSLKTHCEVLKLIKLKNGNEAAKLLRQLKYDFTAIYNSETNQLAPLPNTAREPKDTALQEEAGL